MEIERLKCWKSGEKCLTLQCVYETMLNDPDTSDSSKAKLKETDMNSLYVVIADPAILTEHGGFADPAIKFGF